ncbi:hypothetical protein [Rhizohabitans arisaemae]|uniref:hypothetical protein n=1 Tax=Rhizohabitans arisaemae TaxID=2720610 RepID=UPI0024B10686|nr:hypothetical protein [Rhizohabitans arisaemae]
MYPDVSGYLDGVCASCGEDGGIFIDVRAGVAECRGCGQRSLLCPGEYGYDYRPGAGGCR